MSIKISVIVPIYEVEKEIERCVASVLAQDYTNIELILVNDCSPDKSFDVAKAYIENCQKKITVKLIDQPYNKGVSDARNAGFAVADGDYIFFLDSDDEIASPDVLTFMVDLVRQQLTAPDLILGGYYRVDDFGLAEVHGINRYVLSNNSDVLQYYVAERFWPTATVKLVSRQFLKENEISFKSGIYHEDELWFFHVVLRANTVIGTPKMFYNYWWCRDGSITSTITDKHIADMITLILEMYVIYQQNSSYHPNKMAVIIERFRKRALKMLIQYGSSDIFIENELSRLKSISIPLLATKNIKFVNQNILMKMPQKFIIRYLSAKWRC